MTIAATIIADYAATCGIELLGNACDVDNSIVTLVELSALTAARAAGKMSLRDMRVEMVLVLVQIVFIALS